MAIAKATRNFFHVYGFFRASQLEFFCLSLCFLIPIFQTVLLVFYCSSVFRPFLFSFRLSGFDIRIKEI